jgi:hypothetical protein
LNNYCKSLYISYKIKMGKLILKLTNFLNHKQKKIYIILFLSLLFTINFLLIHKYNIFVADDSYLLSFIKNFNFLDKKYSILCEGVVDNQILVKTIGPLYKIYFNFGLDIVDLFDLKLISIRVFSFLLYLISFYFFLKISKLSKLNFFFLLIFLTLEPFVVMSHSIRHDIFIFFGIILIFYNILYESNNLLKKKLILFLSWSVLITHPSGYPFLLISALFEFFFRRKNFFFTFVIGILTIFFYLYCNNFLKIEHIKNFLELFNAQSVNIRKENAFTFEKFYEYFWLSKYKRHIWEILIFLIYLLNFTYFNKLKAENKFILFIPFIVITIYHFLHYFNISYLKHIYLTCIICTVIVSKENSFNQILNSLIISFSVLCFIIFTSIAIIFLPHDPWRNLYSNNLKINEHISKDNVVSGPFYLLFVNNNINFIPVSALGNNNIFCFPENINSNNIDTIILDTQILDSIKNKNPQYVNLNQQLKNFELVEKIYIGRLATQSLNKQGYMYIYKKM